MKSGSEHELPADTSWEQWIARHAPALLLFARQQVKCESDAQDVVQDAMVEAWERKLTGSPPAVALVYTTIRRRAIDLARRNERRNDRESAAHLDGAHCWFDTGVDERERCHLIQKAMSNLPEIYCEVVTLKVWGGLTFAEIADTLEIPANTAASRYRYGLAELRKLTKEVFA